MFSEKFMSHVYPTFFTIVSNFYHEHILIEFWIYLWVNLKFVDIIPFQVLY